MPLTPQQETAVYNRGGSLLVSAAAGSGKTKVLVERLFSYMEQEGCQVDDFLIITYTKAAAAELRGKIAQELTRRVAERPGDGHLRRQMLRVYQADIKTVDAFCAGLLRENVHLLPPVEEHSLTPDFRVLDEQEAALLRQRVLGRVLEDFYAGIEEDENARLLAETLGAGRDDRALEALVLDLHQKTQSHPHPLRWLEELKRDWARTPEHLPDTGCGRYLMEDALRKADFWSRRLEQAVEDMEDYPAVYKAYGDRFLEAAQALEHLRDKAEQGWDSLGQAVPVFRRMGAVRGDENAACRDRSKAVLEQCKKALKDIRATFSVPEEELLEDLRQMAPAMLALLSLTARFTLRYQAEKVRRNVMDFSDQEHYAIDLLTDGQGQPTDLARQVASRYREVMVDEYQDSNQVQNCIFRALSGEERRLFAVGDVKQSIYRFRLADPTIFLEKYLSYVPASEAEEGQPRKVLLSRNFRSRREVLDGTNFVFRAIMSREMGEMDYGDDEQLYFGAEAAYPPRPGMEPELHFISVENTQEESFDRTEMEARFTARRIRQLLDEKFPVQGEDGRPRPVEPEDIVILMRSPRARLAAYTAALRRENIPCTSGESEAFFSTPEAAVMVSFLQIIDNPRQDVPLIAVLRSPLFGFSADRLALIRALQPEGDYYDALCLDDGADTADFRRLLEELRLAARDMTADRLLWKLYTECHALAVFGAMEGGAARKENLIALYTYAGQQAAAGRGGLFDFVTQLHDLLEEGRQPPITTRTAGSGVQIMSVHRSKGLEFPVVILTDLHKTFNADDFRRPVLVHPRLGLGTERVDREKRIRHRHQNSRGGGPDPGEQVRGNADPVCGPDPGQGEAHLRAVHGPWAQAAGGPVGAGGYAHAAGGGGRGQMPRRLAAAAAAVRPGGGASAPMGGDGAPDPGGPGRRLAGAGVGKSHGRGGPGTGGRAAGGPAGERRGGPGAGLSPSGGLPHPHQGHGHPAEGPGAGRGDRPGHGPAGAAGAGGHPPVPAGGAAPVRRPAGHGHAPADAVPGPERPGPGGAGGVPDGAASADPGAGGVPGPGAGAAVPGLASGPAHPPGGAGVPGVPLFPAAAGGAV